VTLPRLSPIKSPDLVCVECGSVMRRAIRTNKVNGRLEEIFYYCDTEKCQYGQTMSLEHQNCQNAPYVAPAPAPPPNPPGNVEQIPVGRYKLELGDDADAAPSAT
jgi:hypothetical protein